MRIFDRQSDRLEDETLLFVRALPAAVPVLPDPSLEAEMIPALAVAAHSASLEASRLATTTFEAATPVAVAAPRWRLRFAVLAAAVAVLPILMAGLAYAGVDLPDAVDDAFESGGVDLPNQSHAGDVPAGGEGKGDRGKGEAASKNAAGTKGSDEASSPSGDGSNGKDKGSAQKGKPDHAGPDATPPGHGATPPGQGGVPPGNAGVPPGGGSEGSTGPPPDAGPPVAPPSEGGTPPGQGGTPPGQG